MSLTRLIKAAFALIYGYDLDTVVAAQPDWQQREFGPCPIDYVPLPSEEDLHGYQPYYTLSGYVPARTLTMWRHKRFAAV